MCSSWDTSAVARPHYYGLAANARSALIQFHSLLLWAHAHSLQISTKSDYGGKTYPGAWNGTNSLQKDT